MVARASTASTDIWATALRVISLAVPVAIAELGWIAMGTVDLIMVGKLGPAAMGAIGVGGSTFYSFAIFGTGVLLGLDTLVSQAWGAGDRADCHNSLAQGAYLAFFVSVPLMLLFFLMAPMFYLLGVRNEVSVLAGPFIRTLSLSTLPLLLYSAFRRYLQAIGHVQPVMFTLISANLINWFGNWLLIQGHWGFHGRGVVGSALSTCIARIYMAGVLLAFIWWFERGRTPGFGSIARPPDWNRIRRLVRIGLPAAIQIFLEIGAFATAAVLAGRLTPVTLAAHQVAISCASVSFMLALGTASAAAITVGQAVGSGDLYLARRSGFVAIWAGCTFMSCSAIVFLAAPGALLRIYTHDQAVIAVGSGLLVWAAAFQLFDGMQTVTTGALRGLGQTRMPMLVNLGGYWSFGLPIGYLLCFSLGYGIYGIWCGLTLALIVIALLLVFEWNRATRRLLASQAVAILTPRT